MSKRFKIPFNNRGGVVVMDMHMLKHKNYLTLSPQSKVLIILLHQHWRNEKEVDYGTREAADKIPCSKGTAMNAFKQLEDRGFITCVTPAVFSSRTECKARTWKLEWMPFNDRKASNKWEQWSSEN